jgi:hypothetical protein
MKRFLLTAAIAAAALMQAQPSQAYFRGTWCAHIDSGANSSGERCDFPNFATCRAYVTSEPRSFCTPNQWRGENWGITDNRTAYRLNRSYR